MLHFEALPSDDSPQITQRRLKPTYYDRVVREEQLE
jgi:hypothetical protein